MAFTVEVYNKGVEDTMTIVWDEREDCRTVTQFPMHEITTYSGEEMLDRTFKIVYVTYKDGSPKPSEAFTLVTDIQYYNDYIVIEYYKTPDKVSSAIIMTRTIGGIGIEELSKFDAERDWVKMNNAVCGHDFEHIEMSKMTDKLTLNTMKTQYDHQWNTFVRKNHDYGNSFEKSLDTFGLVAGIVRMNDKFERLVSLNDPSKDAQIASESLVDTLEDLSNYAAMAACWLKGKHERNWAKERLTAIKKERLLILYKLERAILKSIDDKILDPEEFICSTIKQISDTVIMKERKGDMLVYMDIADDAGRIAKCVIDNDIPRNKYMGIISRYWHSLGINMPVELREFIYGVLNRYIYYMKKERGLLNVDSGMINADKIKVVPLLGGENEEDRKIAETTKRIDDMLEDIRKKSGGGIDRRIIPNPFNHKPDFDIKLDLEPYLKEHSKKCDEKRLDQAIDLFKYNAAAQAKSQEDIDELFERMLDRSLVSRVVSNGDGTFVAYWEPAEKEEDDED